MHMRKGSDLHVIAGDPPRMRVHGDLITLDNNRLDPEELKAELFGDHERGSASPVRRARLGGLRARDRRRRAVPRERLPAPQRHRRSVPRHSLEGAHARRAQDAEGLARARNGDARPDPRHRENRLRQVDDARRRHRCDQQRAEGPHPHHRGPDRVRASAQAVLDEPTRGRRAQPVVRRRAALRLARGSRRDPRRRAPRPRDDEHRDDGRRDGRARHGHTAHERCSGDDRPRRQHLPVRQAGPRPQHAVDFAARHRIAAAPQAEGRHRPRRRARDPDQHLGRRQLDSPGEARAARERHAVERPRRHVHDGRLAQEAARRRHDHRAKRPT